MNEEEATKLADYVFECIRNKFPEISIYLIYSGINDGNHFTVVLKTTEKILEDEYEK